MTKPRKLTAAERERLKPANHSRRLISLAGGEVAIAPRAAYEREGPDDAQATALQARNRVRGVDDTPEQRMASKAALMGCGVGMCIDALARASHKELWGVWQAICAAKWNYRSRVLGTTGTPQGAAIGFIPERMETNQSATVDLRTADEKDAAAIKADAYWRGLYDRLPTPQHKQALRPAMDEVEGALWRDGKPTAIGARAVDALIKLRAMHEARK